MSKKKGDLISRAALLADLNQDAPLTDAEETALVMYKAAVEDAPAVDAVEVVQCKGCKHCCLDLSGRENHLCMRKEVGFVVRRKADDFCSYGERKDNG